MGSRVTVNDVVKTGAEVAVSGGCQGCFVIVFVVLFGVVWVVSHRRQIAHGGFSILVATILVGLLYLTLTRWLPQVVARRAQRAIDPSAGPTPLADVRAGVVHTAGLVVSAPLHTPLESTPCVYYAITIEAHDGAHVLYSARSAEELSLGDGGGAKMVVKLDGAKWKLGREHVVEDGRVASYLDARGIAHDGALRARITWIEAHDLVFVRGNVARASEGDADYRTNQNVDLVMTSPTITLDDVAFKPTS